ncbi:uncharacterized protein [Nothobranchius furzeri]|uniref:uncharacterized protein isoform X2 n=1 Tax=Nothobranchius furzeri TaxID=105023 RepID=UPI00390485C6
MERSTEVNIPLTTTPGSADQSDADHQENHTKRGFCAAFRYNEFHRRLAICSIICGFSCIGFKALIYSVKAEHATSDNARRLSKKARKYSILSIVLEEVDGTLLQTTELGLTMKPEVT